MPATLFLVAVNLLPILGVVFWGWDAFELLVLYWCETAIIAFWAVLRISLVPRLSPAGGGRRRLVGRVARALFLALNIGIFMCVHMIILWRMFSGDWADRVHGPADFVDQLLIQTGVWLPLTVIFVTRGVLTLFDMAGRAETEHSSLRELFGRIITLQFTLILGGWLAIAFGNRATVVLLVAVRTLIELFYDPLAKKRRPVPV